MCICFIHLNDDPAVFPFRVCLASNRDESINRPAERLQRWPGPDADIIGGRDATMGKENGTWLAVNGRTGRLGCLLNYRDRSFQPSSPGNGVQRLARGTLVPDFLRSSSSAQTFTDQLSQRKDAYEPFLLLMIDPKTTPAAVEGHFFTNFNSQHVAFWSDQSTNQSNGISRKSFAFGNSHPDKPFMKVDAGLRLFEDIVAAHGGAKTDEKSNRNFTDQLLALLSHDTSFYPDDALQNSFPVGFPEEYFTKLSSIFVKAPEKNYGTRTQTLFLLDFEGKATMVERDTTPDIFSRGEERVPLDSPSGGDRVVRVEFALS